MTPPDSRRELRAVRDTRVLDALRLGGSAEVIAAALGISPHLVRRIAFEARKDGRPDAVPPRRPYRRAQGRQPWPGAASFQDVVARAADYDGGSDSTAAIAGQLWGMAHGAGALPHAWTHRVVVLDELLGLAASWSGLPAVPPSRDAAPACRYR